MDTSHSITPWYKQFWPWFIIALPAAVVVAGITTVFIAINNEDSLVVDDYYKEGLAINQVLAQDKVAQRLKLAAELSIDGLIGEILVDIRGDYAVMPATLEMQWIHPTDKLQDFLILLKRTPNDQYMAQLDSSLTGRWYIQLSSAKPEPWRLKTLVKLDFSDNNRQLIFMGDSTTKGISN